MAKSAAKTKTKPKKPAQRRSNLAVATPIKKSARVEIEIGDKVTHKLFGNGKVTGRRGDILSIQFGKAVTKEILADFVAPA